MSSIVAKKSIDSIDFFKGVAILLVVLVHSIQRFSVPYWVTVVPSIGQLGCQVFFVLSSFSLCLGYSDKVIKYFDFFKRRISKMIIGYWSMILFYLFVNLFFAIRDNEPIHTYLLNPGLLFNFLFLHGFSPNKSIVNGIVRGGWFVGTITILYMLFPLLLKVFTIRNHKWNKIKNFVFPISAYVISCTVFILLDIFKKGYNFENNSVSYFSFLNQFPCFTLGFSLFDIYKNNSFVNVKHTLLKFFVCSFVSLFLFFVEIKNTFIFISFFAALSFFYIFIFSQKSKGIINKINSDNSISRIIKELGKISFSVYLTHPIIVHLLIKPIIEKLSEIYSNQIIWYTLLCPVMFVLSYFLAKAFQWYESIVNKIINNISTNLFSHKN